MTEPILPIIHLNGTARSTLITDRHNAHRDLERARMALAICAPNGRDYYLEPGLLEKAQEQHNRRLAVLDGLIDEVWCEILAITESE